MTELNEQVTAAFDPALPGLGCYSTKTDAPLPDLYAYVGEDELGSGEIGLKQVLVPAGMIPMVAVDRHSDRLDNSMIRAGMQEQADRFGKVIRLVRYAPVEVTVTIEPNKHEEGA